MKLFYFCLFTSVFLIHSGCRSAAAPIAVSNRPTAINDRPTTNVPLPPTKPLGDMSWTDEQGRVQKLSDLKGKAVILDFWATYCPPCVKEIPHLNSLIAKHGADNLNIVGLNVGGEEDKPEIPGFVAKTKLDYSLAFPDAELSRFIFSDRDDIPQTLIIDRNGQIIKKIVGFDAAIQSELDAAVEQALAQ